MTYLPEHAEEFGDYVRALKWAQRFAADNRHVMLEAMLRAVEEALGRPFTAEAEAVNRHRNHVQRKHHFGKADAEGRRLGAHRRTRRVSTPARTAAHVPRRSEAAARILSKNSLSVGRSQGGRPDMR